MARHPRSARAAKSICMACTLIRWPAAFCRPSCSRTIPPGRKPCRMRRTARFRRCPAQGIQPSSGPAYQPQASRARSGMHEWVSHAHRRAEPARRLPGQAVQHVAATVDLRGNAPGRRAPETVLWMAVCVVCHAVPAPHDFTDQFWMRFRPVAAHEERSLLHCWHRANPAAGVCPRGWGRRQW